ncbi:hypothetical protein GQX74_011805 [Glossina fuscipes]|nr:hypothetical protein GQX74_011805 [Glossina fuscipes]
MEDGLPKEDTVIQQPSLSTSLNSLNIDPTKSQNQTNLRDLKSENASSRPDDLDLSPGSSKPCTSNKLETLPPDKIVVALDDEHNNADNYSLHSIESFVCRICHNSENPERSLISSIFTGLKVESYLWPRILSIISELSLPIGRAELLECLVSSIYQLKISQEY